jgi:hypothetical protein
MLAFIAKKNRSVRHAKLVEGKAAARAVKRDVKGERKEI